MRSVRWSDSDACGMTVVRLSFRLMKLETLSKLKNLARRGWETLARISRPDGAEPIPLPGQFQTYNHTLPDRYPWLFQFAAASLTAGRDLRLLSFGCSRGDEVFTLCKYFSTATIKGIDVDPANIALCQSRMPVGRKQDITFATAASTESEADESYDAIFCLAVLCLGDLTTTNAQVCSPRLCFKDFDSTVGDLARCLKPGGLLFLHTTNFRFCDAACAADFETVLEASPSQLASDVLFDRTNTLMQGYRYSAVGFRKRRAAAGKTAIPGVPSVSIILPTFNRTRFLRLAVESVFAQTYRDWELVIADDGSDEETTTYLDGIIAPRVRILRLTHTGNPSKVRNSAIKAARGRYLAFLDSDDVWASSKLERQIAALTDRPKCRWSYTVCNHIDENGRLVPKGRPAATAFSEGWIFESLLRLQFSIAMPALVAERDLVQEVGCFDEQQHFGEFHDLCLRLALKSEVVAVREPLSSVRTHDEHYSADRVSAQKSWMRLYVKMATLAPDPHLRSYCAKMRAATSIVVARLQGDKGDFKGVSATLREALPFSRRYPAWWYGALGALARLAFPGVIAASSSPGHGRGPHKTRDSLPE